MMTRMEQQEQLFLQYHDTYMEQLLIFHLKVFFMRGRETGRTLSHTVQSGCNGVVQEEYPLHQENITLEDLVNYSTLYYISKRDVFSIS